jgi:phosphogluconate dehydratase
VLVDPEELAARPPALRASTDEYGTGRELFHALRTAVGRADEGAHVFATLARTAELGEHTLTPTLQTNTEQTL